MVHKLLILKKTGERKAVAVILILKQEIQIIIVLQICDNMKHENIGTKKIRGVIYCYIHGYNSTTGGHSYRSKRTEEQLEKMRGKNHWNYGKKHAYKKRPELYKKIQVYDKSGNLIETCNSQKEASEKYNVAATNIAKVCRGKLKTTGGYIFKYAPKE